MKVKYIAKNELPIQAGILSRNKVYDVSIKETQVRFVGDNGGVFGNLWLNHMFGYKSLGEIFEKIPD